MIILSAVQEKTVREYIGVILANGDPVNSARIVRLGLVA